jgi:hypothetical protein
VVWDRCTGVNPLAVEWPWSAVQVPRNWNICTGNWLRFCRPAWEYAVERPQRFP